jgi:hypothetical protein
VSGRREGRNLADRNRGGQTGRTKGNGREKLTKPQIKKRDRQTNKRDRFIKKSNIYFFSS